MVLRPVKVMLDRNFRCTVTEYVLVPCSIRKPRAKSVYASRARVHTDQGNLWLVQPVLMAKQRLACKLSGGLSPKAVDESRYVRSESNAFWQRLLQKASTYPIKAWLNTRQSRSARLLSAPSCSAPRVLLGSEAGP